MYTLPATWMLRVSKVRTAWPWCYPPPCTQINVYTFVSRIFFPHSFQNAISDLLPSLASEVCCKLRIVAAMTYLVAWSLEAPWDDAILTYCWWRMVSCSSHVLRKYLTSFQEWLSSTQFILCFSRVQLASLWDSFLLFYSTCKQHLLLSILRFSSV